jgi:hypothetical protein
MVLHTDQKHPHVHLVVKAENELGQRLHIDKQRLREWREDFARLMREQGYCGQSSVLRIEDRISSYSCDSKKNCQRPIDRDKSVLMQSADGRANLVTGDRLRLVYHDLRFLSKAIVGIWLNRNSKQWGGA